MTDLTLRRVKGSPLSHVELDNNFTALDSSISAGSFDSGLTVEGGDIVIENGDLYLKEGSFKYNPKLQFHDLVSGTDRVIFDSAGSVLVGTSYNGLGSQLRVTRSGNQYAEIGSTVSQIGQTTFLQLGNAGSADGRSSGVKSTQMSADFEDWKLSLVAYNSTDGFIDAIDIAANGDVTINMPLTVLDSATFNSGMDVIGDLEVTGDLEVNGDIGLSGDINLDVGGSINIGGAPIGSNVGTVTSVALSVPTGLEVANSPIVDSDTFAVTYAATHSLGIPTDVKQGEWDTAFGWGDHDIVGYLTDAPNDANQYVRQGGAWAVATDSDTTYTAGNGISLTGTAFTVDGGNGITATATGVEMSGNYTGKFTATGDIVAFSDMALKENVNPITAALDKVSRLNGYTFRRIGEEKQTTGVMAQEVQAVLPEAVHDYSGTLGVAYGNMVGLLIEAIKELKEEVAHLKGDKG